MDSFQRDQVIWDASQEGKIRQPKFIPRTKVEADAMDSRTVIEAKETSYQTGGIVEKSEEVGPVERTVAFFGEKIKESPDVSLSLAVAALSFVGFSASGSDWTSAIVASLVSFSLGYLSIKIAEFEPKSLFRKHLSKN